MPYYIHYTIQENLNKFLLFLIVTQNITNDH